VRLSDYMESKLSDDNLPNITEKSIIFAPFNTTMMSEEQSRVMYSLRSQKPNGDIHYSSKVREANRQYEFNFNGELDNGKVIR